MIPRLVIVCSRDRSRKIAIRKLNVRGPCALRAARFLVLLFLLPRCTMGRTRLRRSGQRSAHGPLGAPDTARWARNFRPRLELLEERVQLGDTVLGLSALLWGLDFPSRDTP